MKNDRTWRRLVALAAVLPAFAAAGARVSAAIPKKDTWYTQHYVIMQDFERKLYRGLSEEGRQGFRELFWASRTAEARGKFLDRMEYVGKNFKPENRNQPWNTDRGRVYLLNGAPASVDYDQNVSFNTAMLPGQVASGASRSSEDLGANRAEIWVYPYDQYFIKYTFAFIQPNQWRITQTTGNRYLGDLETFNKTVTFGIVDEAAYKEALGKLDRKR